jgi:hypothetical protein
MSSTLTASRARQLRCSVSKKSGAIVMAASAASTGDTPCSPG